MSVHPRVVEADALDWHDLSMGSFAGRMKRLGTAAGGRELGCSLYRLAPSQRAFPAHFHHANEEAIYVLAGEGTLRLGAERIAVRAGTYVAFPAGEPLGHQLINTSQAPLEYLCFSTQRSPEVAEYPDSGKIGVIAAPPPGGDPAQGLRLAYRRGSEVGYTDGES